MGSRYEDFLTQFRAWAQRQNDIRSVFVVGSFGRKNQSAWSDIDLAIITRNPQRYRQAQWLTTFGNVWSAIYEDDPILGLPTSGTLFAVLADGLYVDVAILPYTKTRVWATLLAQSQTRSRFLKREASETAYLFQSGIEILIDRDGLVKRLQSALATRPIQMRQAPTVDDMTRLQDDFYLSVLYMVRHLMQGHPFGAQIVRDKAVRRSLVTLAQWDAQANQQDWNNLLNYRDKHIAVWAHPQFVAAMPTLFNAYGADNLWLSLLASIEIVHFLIEHMGATLHYEIDMARGIEIEQWVKAQYDAWSQIAIGRATDTN